MKCISGGSVDRIPFNDLASNDVIEFLQLFEVE